MAEGNSRAKVSFRESDDVDERFQIGFRRHLRRKERHVGALSVGGETVRVRVGALIAGAGRPLRRVIARLDAIRWLPVCSLDTTLHRCGPNRSGTQVGPAARIGPGRTGYNFGLRQ